MLALFVLVVVSGPLGVFMPRWGRLWAITMLAYAGIVTIESVRHAEKPGDVPGTMVALTIGNLAPGVGVLLKAAAVSPDLRGVYRNDR